MKSMKKRWVGLVLASSLIVAAAQADEPRGQREYWQYCSACHGEAADGNGPVAGELVSRPPPLTKLHEKFGRPLGTDLVAFVTGKTMPRAHGSSDMPIWGRRLQDPDGNDSDAIRTIWLIVDYLQTLQPRDE